MSCCHLLGAGTLSPQPMPEFTSLAKRMPGKSAKWPCCIPLGQHYVKNKHFFQAYFSEALCVSQLFLYQKSYPCCQCFGIARNFPIHSLVMFSCSLSFPAVSRLLPRTTSDSHHLKYSEDSLFSLINCCPVGTLSASPLIKLLLLSESSSFCALIFPLYNLLLPFCVSLCFHGSRRRT